MNRSEAIQHKIFSLPDLLRQVSVWRFLNRRIVFTNGCFDILHRGHIHLLNAASALDHNSVVIVGLNTDASVKRLKGADRPLNSETDRSFVLSAIYAVDAITFFDDDTPLELIRAIQPDYLVKGGDYTEDNIVGANLVNASGGKVVVVPYLENYSSTAIIQKSTTHKK